MIFGYYPYLQYFLFYPNIFIYLQFNIFVINSQFAESQKIVDLLEKPPIFSHFQTDIWM